MALSVCRTETDSKGRETNPHGTAEFPVACYLDDLTVHGFPWHWHDELEAFIVVEGQAAVSAGSKKYIVKTGDGIFVNAGYLHSGSNGGGEACRFHSIVFHPRLVGGGIDSIYWQNYLQPLLKSPSLDGLYLHLEKPWHQEALKAIEAAYQACVQEQEGYEFYVREQLSRIIFLLAKNLPSAQHRPSEKALRDAERIKCMLQYIQENFSENLTLAQIAGSAAISESECLRCFHSIIGTTPLKYVKQFRIQRAAQLLASTSFKIVDIGLQCGFQEMSYFAKTFKSIYGCVPSEYRRKKQEGL